MACVSRVDLAWAEAVAVRRQVGDVAGDLAELPGPEQEWAEYGLGVV